MRRTLLWLLAGLVSMALTLLIFAPAAWMAPLLESQTGGRLTLGDARGTWWHGSAFIGAAPGGSDPVAPLLPGQFSWRVSLAALLLGRVEGVLENAAVLSGPVTVAGGLHEWQIGASSLILPAERLVALGAPLNTLQPSGRMRLSWQPLLLSRQDGGVGANGAMHLDLEGMASRLSPIRPLGDYRLTVDWRGQEAEVRLATVRGPLLLGGSGAFAGGRLRFSGTAEADAGHGEELANLLSLLGQRRNSGGRDVISLEIR
jgi:general secretion pathway protein N